MDLTGLPKSPQPILCKISHMCAKFSWNLYLEKLSQICPELEYGRIIVQLDRSLTGKYDFENKYMGFLPEYVDDTLEPCTCYDYRLRFSNALGFSEWSDILSVQSKGQPLTGQDIHQALRRGSVSQLEKVLKENEENLEAPDILGFSPVMVAAQNGNYDMLKVLLKYKLNLEMETDTGKTALHLAAFKGQTSCVIQLLEAGADIDHRDHNGLSVLHYAVDGEQRNVIKHLLDFNANINAKDNGLEWTPLMRCAGLRNNGNVEVARTLLLAGCIVDEPDVHGKTPLHNAIINNHATLCELLLQHGANQQLKTKRGDTAITLANSLGDQRIIGLLQYIRKKTEIAA